MTRQARRKQKKRRSKRKLQKLYPFINNGQAWMEHPRIVINADGEVKGGPVFFSVSRSPALFCLVDVVDTTGGAILENLTTGKPIFDF
jgi:hypothetical protein